MAPAVDDGVNPSSMRIREAVFLLFASRASSATCLPARDNNHPCHSLNRSSGVLLHPTSLPGGRLGDEAYRFVDWLAAAGQSWWQMLPLGPPDEHGSPYRSASAFACWPGLLADPGRAR